MHTNGTSCSIATSATAASEPSPPAIPSTSAPASLATAATSSPCSRKWTVMPCSWAASRSSSALGEAVSERGLTMRNSCIGGGRDGAKDRPFGPCTHTGESRSSPQMSERGLHTIEDDLSETWVEDWAAVGLAELEALLAKHAAFLGFLETAED